jgi:hypothetical protein
MFLLLYVSCCGRLRSDEAEMSHYLSKHRVIAPISVGLASDQGYVLPALCTSLFGSHDLSTATCLSSLRFHVAHHQSHRDTLVTHYTFSYTAQIC